MLKTLFSAILLWPAASLADDSNQRFEDCLEVALNARDGQVVKVELKLENEREVYEFDIRGIDGKDWDVECLKSSAELIELEQEVNHPNHPLFKRNFNVNEEEARDIALKLYPGEIIEVEYEIESDGKSSYEFDIDTLEGSEIKIEIDAATGKVVETNKELWQVGLE
ncbi:PepSY domain-containing protein [Methylophaga sp.]|uniref:PepSY domain-containing protein n=1 Tax=Methylophaga sp. TaxID=2024840 RepID=UPI00140171C6|nr:PepSY domain-containing protein [Methylophaga sp.]MTI62321.1 peptidase [Methylophaga sp.]